tara:strand:- start:232 stop:429 length:198 start_codon:yes stop_codon:yes gene_type:complete
MPDLEKQYLATKDVIDKLRRHMKSKRDELNSIATTLLNGDNEYIFSDGKMVLKKPANHTATKIKS